MNIHQTVPRSDCTSFAKCGKHSLAYCRRYGASECGPCEIVRRKPRNRVVVDGVERKLCTRCGRALPKYCTQYIIDGLYVKKCRLEQEFKEL